jgi:hypothetical protein
VNELNLTFKKVILFSVLSVLLGFGLIYGISRELKPASNFTPGFMGIPASVRLLVYAYDGSNHSDGSSGFVQAFVTITGPESPITVAAAVGNDTVIDKTFVNETYNGTTTTDLQSPLIFSVLPGEYSVVAICSSAQPQTETLNVTGSGLYLDVFLNFGSVPLPPLGHILVLAWYTGNNSTSFQFSSLVQASITINGSESHDGTTTIDPYDPLIFTVAQGEYTVVGAYGSSQPQTEIVNVTAGRYSPVELVFGEAPFAPPF